MTGTFNAAILVGVGIVTSLACTSSPEARGNDTAPPVEVEQRLPTIDHVSPKRDSVGERPVTFEWTAAKDADSYSIGVWNDIDRLMWRQDRIQGTSIEMPKHIELEYGTYFWSVTAVREGQAVAESGRSAFVVTTTR